MKTIATIRVEFDHADYAARFGIDPFDVPADVRALVEDVASAFRDGGPDPTVTYQQEDQ